ncbi:MAG: starch-binding protein [Ruminococcus sp.]|nr:starch-binding protein [Ruminococcus sp.]
MFYDSKLNKLIRSVVALVLILTFLVTATHAWLSDTTSSKVDTSEFITITADAGLNMNYGYGDNNQGTMQIPPDCILTECSSRDGRNFYFPLSAYGADSDMDFTDGIEYADDFIYREATGLDKNKKYLSLDLELSAENDSNVWLSADSYIKNKSADQTSANAVRVAFIEKVVEGKSIVFDNSPLKDDSMENFNNDHYKPIGGINRDGTGPVVTKNIIYRPHAFNEYTSNNSDGNVLFKLEAGVPLHITVNIWLEGTDPDCTNSVMDIDDLDIKIKFSTTYEAQDTYYFKDYTLEKWVKDDNCYICAVDANINKDDIKSTDLIQFEKSSNYDSDYTWFGSIPEHITNVRFVRLNPETVNASHEEWNYWEAGELGNCKTFNAFGHSAGMWAESFSPTTITLFDATPNASLLSNVHENINSTTPHIMHVSFELEDGNGNMSSHNYKLSYHNNRAQWQINIPSQATDINFKWYDTVRESGKNTSQIVNIAAPDKTWQTNRTDELYFSAYFNGAESDDGSMYATTTTGYWSDELIYVNISEDFENNYSYGDPLVSYFYDTESSFNAGVAMHAKTDSGRYKAAVPPELMQSNMVDTDPNTITVYFTNNNNWTTPKVHCWETVNGADNELTTWPGITMTKSHKNGYGQYIYKAEIPLNTTGLLFSDNGSSSKRTNDIRNVSLYDGIGFYANSDKTYGTFTNYRPAVLFAVCNPNAPVWHWDYAPDYQTPDRLATYGTNNLFSITGFDEEEWYITGEWSYVSNP